MTVSRLTDFRTLPASEHVALPERASFDAVAMLTIYFVLLFALPSSMVITPLASLGRPSMWWGVLLGFWWVTDQLQRSSIDSYRVHQPLRVAVFALFGVLLVSYGNALLRGEPPDQVSPATTSLINLASLIGVLLVAMDGVDTMERFRALIQRLVLAGSLIAALGLAQFATGRSLVDMISIPGMSTGDLSVQGRASFIRAAGTASHPLEYASVLSVCLPLAIVVAIDQTLSARRRRLAWVGVAVIALAAALSVSRSALAGVAICVVLIVPVLPPKVRALFAVGAATMVVAISVLVPGMISTMTAMFTGISDDASAASRTNGLAAGMHFIQHSPVIGLGFGTFLPRYYIFDNEWMGMAIQLGLLGLLAFAAVLGCGIYSAVSARYGLFSNESSRTYGQGIVAALAATGFLCWSFDALSFPQAAGLCMLLPGLGAALRRIHRADAPRLRWRSTDDRAVQRHLRQTVSSGHDQQ